MILSLISCNEKSVCFFPQNGYDIDSNRILEKNKE